MKTTTLNRTVLAALVGSALTFGWGAPATAQAQDGSKGQGDSQPSSQADANAADEQARRNARQARKGQDDSDTAADTRRGQDPPRPRDYEPSKGLQFQAEPRQAYQPPRQADKGQADRARPQPQRYADAAADYRKPDEYRKPDDSAYYGSEKGKQAADVPPLTGNDDSDRYRSYRGDRDRNDGRKGDGDGDRDRRIEEQRRQAENFARQRDSRRSDADRWSRTLQYQNRTSGYRYQQDYYSRLSRQRYDWQNYDYYSDPYFNSAPSYRYYRGGNSYYINNYEADLLRQAINYGYREGIRAGQADRYDGWRSSYRDAYAYQDASYGYRGMYVDYDDYSYYFREGFRRGYEDGYYDNRRYGRSYNGSDNILQTVLSVILDLRPYRY